MVADWFALLAPEAFDRRKAAHLLRRAGFGAPPAQVEAAVKQGLEATVEELLSPDEKGEAKFQELLETVSGGLLNLNDVGQCRAWWAFRMATTSRPLVEKMCLFWHGHFATSVVKVEDARLMLLQLDTLRRHALGNFRELVSAIARDPAMLVYLDGQTNTRAHPNENFARELMELFTCGIGHYTERDVRESARAFTGWHRDGAKFVFHAEEHDADRKEILGHRGRFDGQDVIDLLMQHAATPEFIGRKLLCFFAAPDPAPEAVAAAARLLDRTQLDVKWFLRELFLSQFFYSEDCWRKRISSPAEYAVGTLRTLSARMPAQELAEHMTSMGQALLAPPNVKGWDGEQKWISSSTWPARLAFAEAVSQLPGEGASGPQLMMEKIVATDQTGADKIVSSLAGALLQGELASETRRELSEFLVTTGDGRHPDQLRDDAGFRADKVRGALAMMLSLPEYHAY